MERARNRRRESVLQAAAVSGRRRALRRRLLFGGLGLAALAALTAGLVWGGCAAWHALFTGNEYFQIRQIDVTTDGTLGRDLIQEYAKVRLGQNLFAVRPREIRELLLLVPVIANAQVGRRLPDTLIIEVAERVAVARLGRPGSGSPLAVDATGHVLGPSSVRASLPVILGVRDVGLRPGDTVRDPMLQKALQILELCNQTELRREVEVATLDIGRDDLIDVGLMTGEQVLLSRDRLREKLDKLRAMRSEARRRGLDLAVYDLTVDRNYVGRPADWHEAAPADGD